VPVAFEIAKALELPLDVFVVRKLGLPGHPEFAMGAVASGGVRVISEDLLREFGVTRNALDAVVRDEERELARRERLYRRGRPFPPIEGKTVVLVDDGIATGASMIAAIRAAKALKAARVIVAAPIVASTTLRALLREAEKVECVAAPDRFFAVGLWYEDFAQTSDEEVQTLLDQAGAAQHASNAAPVSPRPSVSRAVIIPIPGGTLVGDLDVPTGAAGLVVFVHGSGSGRTSPRNREVAAALGRAGFATLLFDLLTAEEERVDRVTAEHRFNIPFLASRLVGVTDWIARLPEIEGLPIGYFGASTGAAAAIIAAAARPDTIHAVVSRGGRPDLADASLGRLRAPTLLIVGGNDPQVLLLNREARARMNRARNELAVVPGASHLFEEPGALDHVTRLAADWFDASLGAYTPVYAGGG
jgi:putative phosphoribosyl transferase